MIIGKSKSGVSGGPSVNQYEFCTTTVCKNIVEKFAIIRILLLKELMILLKGIEGLLRSPMDSRIWTKFSQEERFNVFKFGAHNLGNFLMDLQPMRWNSLRDFNFIPFWKSLKIFVKSEILSFELTKKSNRLMNLK